MSSKTIRYRTINTPNLLPNGLKMVTSDYIERTNDLSKLKELENKYDEYLNKNCQILSLLNQIDECIEIRDLITMKIAQIERTEKLKYCKEKQQTNHSSVWGTLELTPKQKQDGYIICNNSPQFHKCGCVSCDYYCSQKPQLRLFNYCVEHMRLKRKLDRLEREVEDLKYNLTNIE